MNNPIPVGILSNQFLIDSRSNLVALRRQAEAAISRLLSAFPCASLGVPLADVGVSGHGASEALRRWAGNRPKKKRPQREGARWGGGGCVSRGPRNTGNRYNDIALGPRHQLGCQRPPHRAQSRRIRRSKIPACVQSVCRRVFAMKICSCPIRSCQRVALVAGRGPTQWSSWKLTPASGRLVALGNVLIQNHYRQGSRRS